ncbi:hypothetical protein [Lactobacillus helveticus]|uniref:hypothetical protein n=1 Tax=Lactobacillus helveticus TaxID=1587 RepID=UPI00283AA9E6|nr:hypothetical protein [Lactobacillus helveticus]
MLNYFLSHFSIKILLALAMGSLMLATPVVMLHEQSKTVLAQKKNGNAKKTKLSDSQIIKNLGVKKVVNSSNDALTAKYADIVRGQQYSWKIHILRLILMKIRH